MKQVIIIRKDLNMRKGKMIAQGAHASMAAILGPDNQVLPIKDIKEWLDGSFTKICVYVESEQELHKLYMEAFNKLLPCSYIVDNGLTEFNGKPTATAVAIGPGRPELIDEITGSLPLL